MPIESRCRGCSKMLRVADEHAGKQARCPECGYIYTVPTSSMPPPVGEQETPIAGPGQMGALAVDDEITDEAEEIQTHQPVPGHDAASASISQSDATEAWYMQTPEGQIYGPVSRRQLDVWVAEGRVTDDCQTRQGENGTWRSAADVFPVLSSPRSHAFGSPRGTTGGVYSRPTPYGQPGGNFAPQRQYVQSHRASTVLVLAILGWVFWCMILSIIALILATEDLRKMRAGQMDPSGIGTTQTGQIVAAVQIILTVLAIIGFCCLAIIGDM